MRRFLHAAVVLLATLIGALCVLPMAFLCGALFVAAERIRPHTRVGNCWSYVVPRWFKFGGTLGIQVSRGVAFSGVAAVPHAVWIRKLGTADILHTEPIRRRRNRIFPWFTFLFPFRVTSKERHVVESDWAELSDSR